MHFDWLESSQLWNLIGGTFLLFNLSYSVVYRMEITMKFCELSKKSFAVVEKCLYSQEVMQGS